MRCEVVIPWRGDCPHRERALERVLVCHGGGTLVECPPGPWVKALAVMPAIERSAAEIVVVADADVWCDGISDAVRAVEDGASWAIPHLLVRRLTEDGQEEQRPYRGVEGGGLVVVRRSTALEIPLDPRFVGWGSEDESWAAALTTLAGRPWRGTADLRHAWHPPQERLSRVRGSHASWLLRRRYFRARTAPAQMRALVQEARDALDSTAQPAGHDHAALGVG